jgi:hypothetical protein
MAENQEPLLQKGSMGTTEGELRRMLALALDNGSRLYRENKQLRTSLTESEAGSWRAGRVGYDLGLEKAALRIEELGGEFAFLISPGVAAREIRALKEK